MNKPSGIGQKKIPFALNFVFRLLSAAVLVYSIVEVYAGFDNGFIVRRGIQYTLEEEPRSFWINVGKWSVIACVCLYISINGIPAKSSKSADD
jgi:hypothetical protein